MNCRSMSRSGRATFSGAKSATIGKGAGVDSPLGRRTFLGLVPDALLGGRFEGRRFSDQRDDDIEKGSYLHHSRMAGLRSPVHNIRRSCGSPMREGK